MAQAPRCRRRVPTCILGPLATPAFSKRPRCAIRRRQFGQAAPHMMPVTIPRWTRGCTTSRGPDAGDGTAAASVRTAARRAAGLAGCSGGPAGELPGGPEGGLRRGGAPLRKSAAARNLALRHVADVGDGALQQRQLAGAVHRPRRGICGRFARSSTYVATLSRRRTWRRIVASAQGRPPCEDQDWLLGS